MVPKAALIHASRILAVELGRSGSGECDSASDC